MFYQIQFQFIQPKRFCCIDGCGRNVADQNDQECELCSAHKCDTRGCNSACILGRSAFCRSCTTVITRQQPQLTTYIIQHVAIPHFVIQAQDARFDPNKPRLCSKCRHMFVSRLRDDTYCVNCAPVGYCSF